MHSYQLQGTGGATHNIMCLYVVYQTPV